ncbi:MAG: TA system VapC family ribonuclease toxin [Nitriliruptorales bacterium]
MTHLLDGNLLVALVVEDHVHHDVASAWFGTGRPFATCPITQGTLLRLLLREGMSAADAKAVLVQLTDHRQHEFWTDDLGYESVDLARVVGHRQVTDAYLAQLARARSGRLATLDGGVAATHPDVAEPVGPAAL